MSDDQLLEADEQALEAPDSDYAALRDILFRDVLAEHNAERAYNRERSRAGWWVGATGALIGVLGVGAAAIVAATHVPQVRYTEIDDASGVIRPSYGAKDAPDHFNDRVIRHYLAEYVSLRERFVWAMDPETDHRVKIMSSPDEQRRYEADRAANNPATKYGMAGYARVTRFVAFTPRGKGKDKTLEYDVQFIKGEVLANNPTEAKEHYETARIIFQLHPEIKMSDADRLFNESGLMVMSYNATVDR